MFATANPATPASSNRLRRHVAVATDNGIAATAVPSA